MGSPYFDSYPNWAIGLKHAVFWGRGTCFWRKKGGGATHALSSGRLAAARAGHRLRAETDALGKRHLELRRVAGGHLGVRPTGRNGGSSRPVPVFSCVEVV